MFNKRIMIHTVLVYLNKKNENILVLLIEHNEFLHGKLNDLNIKHSLNNTGIKGQF